MEEFPNHKGSRVVVVVVLQHVQSSVVDQFEAVEFQIEAGGLEDLEMETP